MCGNTGLCSLDDVLHKVECLNPSQALRWFIAHSLTKQISAELSIRVFISLISLLSQDEHTLLSTLTSHATSTTPSQTTNILFDEDPINDYAEDILVLEMVVKAFQDIQPLSATGASQLAEVLPGLVQLGQQRLTNDSLPWEDVGWFKTRMKLRVLAPIFKTVRQQISDDSCLSSWSQCLGALEKLSIV